MPEYQMVKAMEDMIKQERATLGLACVHVQVLNWPNFAELFINYWWRIPILKL